MLFRFLIWTLIFYFLYKIFKYFKRLVDPANNQAPNNNPMQEQPDQKQQYRINEKDIIDADFTEIKDKDEEKKKQST